MTRVGHHAYGAGPLYRSILTMEVIMNEFERLRQEKIAVNNAKLAELEVLEAAEALKAVTTSKQAEKKQFLPLPTLPLQVTTRSQSQQHPRFHAVDAAGHSSPCSVSASTQQTSNSSWSGCESSDDEMDTETDASRSPGLRTGAGADSRHAESTSTPKTKRLKVWMGGIGILPTPGKVQALRGADLTPGILSTGAQRASTICSWTLSC
jgi:hypothetical protein